MAWRKPQEPAHIEPPGWYRSFDLAAWDEPDGQEQAMMAGQPGYAVAGRAAPRPR